MGSNWDGVGRGVEDYSDLREFVRNEVSRLTNFVNQEIMQITNLVNANSNATNEQFRQSGKIIANVLENLQQADASSELGRQLHDRQIAALEAIVELLRERRGHS